MATSQRGWIRASLWIGLAGMALLVWFNVTQRIRLIPAQAAQAASELTLRRPDGSEFDLVSLRGRVVVLNAWASWCGPCRTEIPYLGRIDRDMRGDGLEVLGLNVEDVNVDRASKLARDLGVTYAVVVPGSALTGTFRGSGSIPQTWLVDKHGRVRASHVGPVDEKSLRKACRTLLDEP